MFLSMTGYGRAEGTFEDKTIVVEIRSLNSKFSDIKFKMPQLYRNLEPSLRKTISAKTERGKIDVNVEVKSMSGDDEFALNTPLFKRYYNELSALSTELGMEKTDIMQAILRLPNVVTSDSSTISKEEVAKLNEILKEALEKFHQYRLDEGGAMEKDCIMRINNILNPIGDLAPFEAERVEKLKARLKSHMEEYVGKDNIDANRFEQEVLYYLEKLDITEEKVRLEQHCKYFLEELEKKNLQKGRKLSFITQEMGREINTLGSKANSPDIQRIVVKMKDELEKIKEQLANSV